jgi:hypothetical protein
MTTTTAPDLWPGMDRDTPTARAWVELWSILGHDHWTPWADAVEHLGYSHPEVKRKTIDNLIRKAKATRLVQKRGGYSHKNHTDNRMIRRHPFTQETTAS